MAIALPHLFRPAPLRKRLWQGGTLLALVTLIFAGANFVLPAEQAVSSKMLGHDFLAFYTAGEFVREGRLQDLYDLPRIAEAQQRIAAEAGLEITVDYAKQKFGPWWNPPFYAWVFAPLSLLSFGQALAVWTLMNLAAFAGAVVLLVRMLAPRWMDVDALGRPVDWKTTGLIPLLLLLSMPFVQAVSHGQNTLISLCIVCAVAYLWRNKRAVLAGGCCALLAYKPQLAAVLACVLVCNLGVRALIGLGFVGSAMVLITQLTMPGALLDWVQRLPANVHFMQVEHAYLWERHATLKAFWRLLFQGKAAGEMSFAAGLLHAISFLALAAFLVRAAWSQRGAAVVDTAWARVTESQWRDRLICATICCAPLLMPFYFDYDLLLLAVPAVLLAGEALARPADAVQTFKQKWLGRAWLLLYVWMLINPGMASMTRVNLNVVLLSAIAFLMVFRATRPAPQVRVVRDETTLGDVAIPRQAA